MSAWRVANRAGQYGLLAMILHWLSAIIIIALLMGGFVMAGYVLGAKIWAWYGLHKQAGLVMLSVSMLRIGNRYLGARVKTKSVRIHMALYGCLLLMPLSGWIMSSSAGFAPKIFGVKLAIVPSGNTWLTQVSSWAHLLTSLVFVGLIVWHVAELIIEYHRGSMRIFRMSR